MIKTLSALEGIDEIGWKNDLKCKMATSCYCKIAMEEWKECSAEPNGSSHLNDATP